MSKDIERKTQAILKILSEEDELIGASRISGRLKELGIDLTERAVRYHLKIMDERKLTRVEGKQGRVITEKGLEELKNALVSDKVGMIISKIDRLSYLTDFDLKERVGKIILNVSLIPADQFEEALDVMKDVFSAKLCMSELVMVAFEGEKVGSLEVPTDAVGFGTVCSVTLNGLLFKRGIPVRSRFGAILEMKEGAPNRFTDLINYEGSSLDPLEIFIKSRMTSVREAAKTGFGKILAGFREVSAAAADSLDGVLDELMSVGIDGTMVIGRPNQPVLETPVMMDSIGIVVAGGLNPLAAVEEAGIETKSRAMSTMVEFTDLGSFWDLF
ncbi:MAG: NrpR regulatory domain-containing protein [Actinomycetota bacterium]|nr:NrpR regulatory domain-containing protein [Actinomycetota bacterium]